MKKIFALILSIVISFLLFACQGEITEEIDVNKTQLYVDFYTGGYGSAWIQQAKKDFEAENTTIQVIIRETQGSTAEQVNDLKSGKPSSSIYFSVSSDFHEAIYAGATADMSDILELKVDGDGEEVLKIAEKIKDYDLWSQIGKDSAGNGFHMLPNSSSVFGQVFDYNTFVDKGWLTFAPNDNATKNLLTTQGITFEEELGNLIFVSSNERTNYSEGDYIMSKGKDGKFGTYDDGQPITEQEYYIMLQKIKDDGAFPFMWTGQFSVFYTQPISEAVLAHYLGEEGLQTYYSYNGTFTDLNNQQQTVTPQTGYKVFTMPELKKAIEFTKNVFMNPVNYHPDAIKTDTSHTGAQNKFLFSFDTRIIPSAFLFEGSWWENEAKPSFTKIINEGYSERGYGKRDYRYMLLPDLEGQKATKSYFSALDSSAMVISSKQTPAMLQLSKKFVAFTLKDEYLRLYQKNTGVARPYHFEMSQADIDALTPFARNLMNLIKDTDNIKVLQPSVEKFLEPINYLSGKPDSGAFGTTITSGINAGTYTNLFLGLERLTAQQFFDGMANYASSSKWSGYYNNVKSYYE